MFWVCIFVMLTLGLCAQCRVFGEPIKRVQHIRELVAAQKKDLDDRLLWTWNELEKAETQIGTVAKERDDWKLYGDDQHDKWMNAETRVAKAEKRNWICYSIIGGMVVLTGVYAYLRIGLHLPI